MEVSEYLSYKFPDFIRYAVQRLKTLCPTLGKVKMADSTPIERHHNCTEDRRLRMLRQPQNRGPKSLNQHSRQRRKSGRGRPQSERMPFSGRTAVLVTTERFSVPWSDSGPVVTNDQR